MTNDWSLVLKNIRRERGREGRTKSSKLKRDGERKRMIEKDEFKEIVEEKFE